MSTWVVLEYKIGPEHHYELFYHIHLYSWIFKLFGPTWITQLNGKFGSIEQCNRYVERLNREVKCQTVSFIEV